jgi:hypothetical protein
MMQPLRAIDGLDDAGGLAREYFARIADGDQFLALSPRQRRVLSGELNLLIPLVARDRWCPEEETNICISWYHRSQNSVDFVRFLATSCSIASQVAPW